LKVKVFPFFNTSLKVNVLKLVLKYSNALLLLRYCTTLKATHPQRALPFRGLYLRIFKKGVFENKTFISWGTLVIEEVDTIKA